MNNNTQTPEIIRRAGGVAGYSVWNACDGHDPRPLALGVGRAPVGYVTEFAEMYREPDERYSEPGDVEGWMDALPAGTELLIWPCGVDSQETWLRGPSGWHFLE